MGMNKPTFKEFLSEYRTDPGTMALLRDKEMRDKERAERSEFAKKAASTSPGTNQLVRGKKGYYRVVSVQKDAIYVRQLGDTQSEQKPIKLPRAEYRFKQVEDSKYPNKAVFQVAKRNR
jgi:hypothetical protein